MKSYYTNKISKGKLRLFTALITAAAVFLIQPFAVLADSAVAVDGLYDDWNGIPSTDIFYGGFNANDVSSGAMYTDGDYLYIHIDFADSLTYIPLSSFVLTLNNDSSMSQRLLIHHGPNDLYNCVVPTEPGIYTDMSIAMVSPANNYRVISFTDFAISYTVTPGRTNGNGNGNGSNNGNGTSGNNGNGIGNGVNGNNGNGVGNRPATMQHEFELRISLEELAAIFGLTSETVSTITLGNPSLGSQQITIAGSSSGPYVAVAIGAVLALGGAYYFSRKAVKARRSR